MNEVQNKVKNLTKSVCDTNNPAQIADKKDAIEDLTGRIDKKQLVAEINEAYETQQNLAKKVIFEKFCEVAIGAELTSLNEEAKGIKAKEEKRGITRLIGGVSKSETKRREDIEKFVDYNSKSFAPPFKGLTYSARDILADMKLFIEDHEGDPKYQRAIAEVQKLEDEMHSCFGVSKLGVEKSKEAKKAQRDNSHEDKRSYRINNLRSRMEQKGVCAKKPRNQALSQIRGTIDMLDEEIRDVLEKNHTRTYHQDNNGGEIS